MKNMRFSGVPTPKCENRGVIHAHHPVHEHLIWHHRSGGKINGKQHGGDAGSRNQSKIYDFLVSPHQNAKTVAPPIHTTQFHTVVLLILKLSFSRFKR